MNWISALSVLLVLLLHGSASSQSSQLVAAAKKEGALKFYGPSTLTHDGVQLLAQAFNKKHSTNIKVTYYPSKSMTAEVNKMIGLSATGIEPEYDVMAIIDGLHGALWTKKLHVPFDYAPLGIDPKTIHFDSGTVSVANQIVLPGYNTNNLAAHDVPKRWEDLLDPKWKGRKIGIPTATGQMDYLAIRWGEQKFIQFATELAKQEPIPGRLGELYTRLQIGEILIASTLIDSFVNLAEKTKAPIAQAQIQPVVAPAYHAGVLKGSANPNAGHLFVAFLVTPEAQSIWEKHGGESSAFIAGTKMHRYVQGKDVIYLTQKDVQMVNRVTAAMTKIFGFSG
jgi:iron(III) transport system substrate-binding protein